MEEDKDAICEIMENGLWVYGDHEYHEFTKEESERAHALWRKHCDPEAIECRSCGGLGYIDDWVAGEEYQVECEECYGTGKVDAPLPPPPQPPPPKVRYSIQSGGILNGKYRAWAWSMAEHDGPTWEKRDSKLFSGDTELDAINQAQAWIDNDFNQTYGGFTPPSEATPPAPSPPSHPAPPPAPTHPDGR